MMNDTTRDMAKAATSTSFAVDLGKWLSIMEAYEGSGHAYHATMPTDALRALLAETGIKSVAADGFEAPGVVVSYTANPDIEASKAFAAEGVQIAAGVPLMVDEGEDYSSFRLGLFGLDKLYDVDASVARLEDALKKVP